MKPFSKKIILLLKCLLAFSIFSCSLRQKEEVADIQYIYQDAAKFHGIDTVPVIVIPGILGSNLVDQTTGKPAWGTFHGDYSNPATAEGLKALALQPQYGTALKNIPTNLRSNGALESAEFKALGLTLHAQAYAQILQTLGTGGFKDESVHSDSLDYGKDHFTCFQFDYDWRYSNVENAKKLDEFITAKKKYIRQKIKEKYGVDKKDIKFNIIAHSMGGLVARYYARYGTQDLPTTGTPTLNWAGAKNINQLFVVATPNSGSALAMEELLSGKQITPKWLKWVAGLSFEEYPAELLGTYPSIYELLPRTRHNFLVDAQDNPLDAFSYELWEKQGWGLAGANTAVLRDMISSEASDEELHTLAKEHLAKCLHNAKQFHKAIDKPARSKPAHLQMNLFVGDSISTLSQLKLVEGELVRSKYEPGDQTVIRSSVLADEKAGGSYENPKINSPIPFDHSNFIFGEHVKLTADTGFSDNILFELLQR